MTLRQTYQQDVGNGYYNMVSPMITGEILLAGQRSISGWFSGLGIPFNLVWVDHFRIWVDNESGMYGVIRTNPWSRVEKVGRSQLWKITFPFTKWVRFLNACVYSEPEYIPSI